MKKYFCFVIIFVVFIVSYYFLNNNISVSKKHNMSSQIEYNYFNLQAERYFAECNFGVRELYFEYDGESTQKVDYGIFRVVLNFSSDYAKSLNAVIKINDKTVDVVLEKNPFDNSFMCDICKVCSVDDDIEILIENIDFFYNKFNPVTSTWNIDYQKALDLSFIYLNDFIKQNKKSCEGYLTIIYSKYELETTYFWCYRVVTNDHQTRLVVFDINKGDIVLMS